MSRFGAIAWIEKARQDARSARRLLIEPPELEDAAYHLHQAVEKAIKAVLTDAAIAFPRGGGAGHDLGKLTQLVPSNDPLRARAHRLSDVTPWATAFRYPADDPLTAQPAPTREEIGSRLNEAEAFVEAVVSRLSA